MDAKNPAVVTEEATAAVIVEAEAIVEEIVAIVQMMFAMSATSQATSHEIAPKEESVMETEDATEVVIVMAGVTVAVRVHHLVVSAPDLLAKLEAHHESTAPHLCVDRAHPAKTRRMEKNPRTPSMARTGTTKRDHHCARRRHERENV